MKTFLGLYPVILMIVIDIGFAVSNILVKEIVGEGFDRLVFITYRQFVSALFLAPIAFFLERKNHPRLSFKIICQLFLSALLGATVSQYLFLLGIQNTSATFACAFLNMVPVFTFVLALLLGQEVVKVTEKSGIAKLLGALVCICGVILLTCFKGTPLIHFSKEQHVDSNTKKWVLGSMALVAGTLCWSSWFLLQTRLGKTYPFPYSSTAFMSLLSALQSAICCLSIDRNVSIWLFKRNSDIFIILFTGIISSGLCFVGMSWCVKKHGPVFTAAFSPLVQIMAAAYEVPVFREQLHLVSVLGSGTVIAGLYLLLWGKDRDMKMNQEMVNTSEEIKEEEERGSETIRICIEPRNSQGQQEA